MATAQTQPAASAPQAGRQIARAAGTVMAAFVLSNLTGLLRQMLISDAFGTTTQIDAFYAAAVFPDLLFMIMAGGALGSAFLPTFTGLLAHDQRQRAWRLFSGIANLVFSVLTVLSIISAIFAPWIVRLLLAPQMDPAGQDLAAHLLRILLIAPAWLGISGLFMSTLNAHQKFLLPALAPTFYWLGMIFGVLVLTPSMGIDGLAWGAVLGAAMHGLVQLPGVLRLPGRVYTLTFGLDIPETVQVVRLMLPRLLGVSVVQLHFVINAALATGMAEGSLSAIRVAWAVMTMPQVVIAQAIAIAALPTFSAQAAVGDKPALRASLSAVLRGLLMLAIPATAGLILLREPLIAAIFERGEFTAYSTQLVAWALLWYATGLIGHSLVEVVSRAFYALNDTRTPVGIGVAAMLLNIVLSFVFAWLFQLYGYAPHGGLALANSLATTLEAAALLWLMRGRLEGLNGGPLLRGILISATASLAMSAVLAGVLIFGEGYADWMIALVGVSVGVVIYAIALIVLRAEETRLVLGWITRRVRR